MPACALALAAALAATASDDPSAGADNANRPVVGARLAWLSTDALDLVGDAWADVPFWHRGRQRAFFALDLRTTIAATTNSFDFVLRDLDYGAHLGWRLRPANGPVGALSAFVGQRGKALVDVDGHAWVRYVAAELRSDDFRRIVHPGWLEWAVALGPVIDERGLDADAWFAGSLRLDAPRNPARTRAARVGFDLRWNGLLVDGDLEADVTAGPHLVLPTGEGQSAVLFAHYQWSGNPLGLGADTWLVGLEFVEDETATPPRGAAPAIDGPAIDGFATAGVGTDERVGGTLFLRALSPQFAGRYRGAGILEINALTSATGDELFYRYALGLEAVFAHGIVGIWFYHRSNHLLSDDGPGITSINVLEGGWQTVDWYRVGTRGPRRRWGSLDGAARVGWLLESTFGEERRWHAQGGVRWTTPFGPGATQLYLRIALEAGDVATRSAAVGLAASSRLEVEAEWRDDEQYFTDPSATLLNVRYSF